MQINGVVNCCKPQRKMNFKGSESSEKSEGKVLYKRLMQTDDDTLRLRSIMEAHKEVEHSGKAQILKNLPAITAGLIGTSIAIAQPGKLSAKAAKGLGFLALVKACSETGKLAGRLFDKSYELKGKDKTEDRAYFAKKLIGVADGIILTALGAGALVKYGPEFLKKNAQPVYKFIKNDTQKLARDINNSKLGKFVSKKINPFVEKHQKGFNTFASLSPFAFTAGAFYAGDALSASLNEDFIKKSEEKYIRSKTIQEIAKRDFDKIDAIEA